MLKLKRVVISAVLSISLFGCTATGELFKPSQGSSGMSLVYIFRANSFAASGSAENIYVDGKKLVSLSPGGYCFVLIPPGEHAISSKMMVVLFMEQEIGVKLITEADKTYYVKVGATLYVGEIERRIAILDEAKAFPELSSMRLQEPSKNQ